MAQATRIGVARIAVDWGTSNLRAFALDAIGGLLAEAASDRGMGAIGRADYEPALLTLIDDWLDPARVTPVLVCGMAGARQGWIEAPYRQVPCTPVGGPLVFPPVTDPRITVAIVPGLSQADPADVMRGEETQIAGVLATVSDFEGVICLPGTHSKWVEVRAGRVERFQTLMTGEIFALLSSQSVLRHGMATDAFDEAAFLAGVRSGFDDAANISAALFRLRAEGLLAGLTPAAARSRLSGLLIGLELAAARPYWHDRPTLVIGSGTLGRLYGSALSLVGADHRILAGEAMARAGLATAFHLIREHRG